jgi:purine-cytosine permease-like protein
MTSPTTSEKAPRIPESLDQIDEYEREPVPQDKVKGFRSFLGMVAGEHIAGTEFVIGPLFVIHGAGTRDVFLGLLVGNILATLSWTLICAPTAVKTRLTIFFQLEKISGRGLVAIYNAVNGLLFCVSASAMIGVSASAVGTLLGLPTPGLTDLLPPGPVWVVSVTVIGLVMSVVATYGFDRVSRFANVFAPWMPLIFLAGAIAALPGLGVASPGGFWAAAQEKIWTGVPQAGQAQYGFWHVMIFAWLCNSAMHIGLTDMSIYRYARRASYGLASAAGMFIGHYMAWVASGILCAVALQQGNANPSPGEIAYRSVGLAGVICVLVAGWTTANPTIYRAGLAIQGLFPGFRRWKLTMIVGLTATALAWFPAIVSKLDQFLGIYALIGIPVGAIVLVDVYLFRRLGLTPNLAVVTGSRFNAAVAIAWFAAVAFGYALFRYTEADFFFFMALPGWFVAAILYVLVSALLQGRRATPIPETA